MTEMRAPNRLIHEKSPYLLQHAYNPVDWHTWGDEAFVKARAEDKPIFLSSGYSTCHWCHVMERESFEDEQIAALLNSHFVPVKLDREERPDVDRVYMTALQAMGQHGGWPMSMFLTPDLEPFYGGTYFPPDSRYGRAGFGDVLLRVNQIWREERDKVHDAASRIHAYLREVAEAHQETTPLNASVADMCFQQLTGTYDPELGGFGGGPKFPRPAVFAFLLRYHQVGKSPVPREMTEKSLQKMAQGGVYDHVGGGFHRYSVDAEWRVPHFEKMLYDQAQLVRIYLDAFRLSQDPAFADVARDTLSYVQRDMTSPEGGFYSAEDADSARPENPEEQGEGAFYVWTKKELLDLLKEDAPLFCYRYGVEEEGNATVDPQHEFTGRNILYEAHSVADMARVFHLTAEEIQARLRIARARLLAARELRRRPLRDDKILASWNGLMISAFAHAYQVFGEDSYHAAAEAAADAVLNRMYDRSTETLLHRYRDGEARFNGHLDDYAFFVQALIDLYESTGAMQRLVQALHLMERQIQQFWDETRGGFFETAGIDQSLLVRMKEQYDGAEPTGNSVSVSNLVRLARITDKPEWEVLARTTLDAFSPWLSKQPAVMPNMVASFIDLDHAPRQIVFSGPTGGERMRALQREVFSRYRPDISILYSNGIRDLPDGGGVSARVAELTMLDGLPTAYLCEDFVCHLPASDPKALSELLG